MTTNNISDRVDDADACLTKALLYVCDPVQRQHIKDAKFYLFAIKKIANDTLATHSFAPKEIM